MAAAHTGKIKYVKPATINDWGVIFVSAGQSDGIGDPEIKPFVGRFMQECRARGMQINDPCFAATTPTDLEKFEEVMQAVRGQRLEYCLIIHTDNDAAIHDAMKTYETKYHVVTQVVRVKTVIDVVRNGKQQTMENIVNKTNVKLGGINYSLKMSDANADEGVTA